MRLKIITLLLSATLLAASCRKYDISVPAQPPASDYSSAIATEWMDQLRQIVRTQGMNPPQASRIYAYAGITVYESALPGLPGNKSLEGQIPLLTNLPKVTHFGKLDYQVTINEAIYSVAKTIFPTLTPASVNQLDAFYTAKNEALLRRVYGPVYQESKEFGQMVANAVLQRAAADGFSQTRTMSYTVPSRSLNASYWAPTGSVTSPLEPYWGKIKCFTMENSSDCEEPSQIAFNTTSGSSFYNQALEVYNTSRTLTQDQKDIALWWADGAGTATPPGHWVGIATKLAQSRNLSLDKVAEMYVLLNMALGDAFISCWDAKYKYNLLRPQTYIREYIAGANNWSPLISTPPFPEYPSGHSVSSGAAAEILTHIFGNVSFTDDTNTYLGLNARRFTSFYQAADEAAMSRLYGGIHYREANENGIKQGKTLGQVVVSKIKLK